MERLRRRPGSWTARPAVFLMVVTAVALLAAGAERALVAWRGHPLDPTGAACWIWARGVHRSPEPIAFYAARGFELAEPSDVEVTIAADETYCLFLDGRRLGASSYRAGAAADRYAVAGLAAGRHRLVVELRSSRGAGGLLAVLRLAGEPRPLLVSDDSWRVYRSEEPQLFDPAAEIGPGEPPQVWQRAPTGRWRVRPAVADRPHELPAERAATGERRHRRYPTRVRRAVDGGRWLELARWQQRFPDLGERLLLDWGGEVVGLLELDLASSSAPPALAWFGTAPPDPEARPPDEVMVFVPGSESWRSAHVRRFRWVLLVGVRPASYVRALPVDADLAEVLGPPPRNGGVFGIRPAPASDGVVEEVWRRAR